MPTRSPYSREIVHGTPIHALGHTLIPVARIISLAQHHVTIRERKIEGQSAGLVLVQPLHVIDVREHGKQVLPIRDATAQVIGLMALAAAVISLVSLVLIVANHRAQSRH